MRIFRAGGNAVDAGVAAGIALGVVERDLVDFAGVAPVMVFRPGMKVPITIDGLGRWPHGLSLARYLDLYQGEMPVGISRSVTPGAPDAWFTALAKYGSLTLAQVLEPAIELAHGMPMFPRLAQSIAEEADRLRQWPSSAEVFLPGGRVPRVGETFRQPDLARLLESLVAAESSDSSGDRSLAILAARDFFYHGDPAERIASFMAEQGGHLTRDDLRSATVEITPATASSYRGSEVFSCGPWSQGPVVPMALNIIEQRDLSGLGPQHPEFLHVCAEALKLAFSDREAYFGDPAVVDVPLTGLLDKGYARGRHRLVRADASQELPEPGDPWFGAQPHRVRANQTAVLGERTRDTGYVAAMDAQGNAFSATPSDSGLSGPVVPGLGVVVSTRGSQFFLDPEHPSCIAPGKRPRLTPNPAMLMRDGRPTLVFGCPGGDSQPQAMVQVVCRMVDFGLSTQEAIDLPRVVTLSVPDSFYPHASQPGVLLIEDLADGQLIEQLRNRGHVVRTMPGYSRWMGAVCAVRPVADGLEAGADPRRDSMAAAW